MSNVYKCASYSRLSKKDDNRTDESSSISSQKLIISSFTKFNNLEIVKKYQDDGYSGGNFDRPGFKQMIDDIGNMVQNTYNKISYNSKIIKKVNPKDYIIVENTHEPLVSKEIFDRVQQGLKSRTKTVNLERKQKKSLFTGLLYYKDCGRTLNIYEKNLKSHNSYYTQCNLYTKKGKYGYCSPHRINYRWLEADLIEYIRKMGEDFLEKYESGNLIEQVNNIMNEDKVENKIDEGTYQRLT